MKATIERTDNGFVLVSEHGNDMGKFKTIASAEKFCMLNREKIERKLKRELHKKML
jgi:hypothetical protein